MQRRCNEHYVPTMAHFREEITPRLVYQATLPQYYLLWPTNQALTTVGHRSNDNVFRPATIPIPETTPPDLADIL
jgi:hypothetical protein